MFIESNIVTYYIDFHRPPIGRSIWYAIKTDRSLYQKRFQLQVC